MLTPESRNSNLTEQQFAMKVGAAAVAALVASWAGMALLAALAVATFVPTQVLEPLSALLLAL